MQSEGQWEEQLSLKNERCRYCKSVILKKTIYFRKCFDLDSPTDRKGKNACQECKRILDTGRRNNIK